MNTTTLVAGDPAELIKQALAEGHAVILPAAAPVPTASPNTERNVINFCTQFGLRRGEGRALAVLMGNEYVSHETLRHAMMPNSRKALQHAVLPGSKTVNVTLSGLRKKLAPHNIEIETLWGHGYRISEGTRDKLKLIAGTPDATTGSTTT